MANDFLKRRDEDNGIGGTTMANARKYGYYKPVKNNNPVRWVPTREEVPRGKKKKAG